MDFFITRPILSASLALMMLLAGGVSAGMLPIAEFPPIVPPEISITTTYPGASAKVVADAVTTPIEEQVNGADGMIYMSSESSNNGQSTITVTFEIGTDPRLAQVEVQNRTSWALPMLPEEVTHEGVIVQQASQDLLLAINLVSPNGSRDAVFLGNYLDIHVTDAIKRLPGVAQTTNFGLRKYAIRVWVDPGKLTNLGLLASDVTQAIEDQNRTFPAGILGEAPSPPGQPFTMQLLALGRLSSVEEFEDIILRANPDGSVVRIKDVARVELGAESYSTSFRLNGVPGAALLISPRADANAVDLTRQVKATMEELARYFPDDVAYMIPYNTTRFVEASIKEVLQALGIAIMLVFLVVYLFLQSVRATLIPSIAIPVSLVGTLAFMNAFGFSFNSLSLLGLVLAVGLVVDDAIVVVENVERRLNSGEEGTRVEIAMRAMREVRGPIVATTIVLMSVFVPVAFMPGLTGRLYNQFSMTIAISVFLSGINSLTLSPALAALLLRRRTREPHGLLRGFNRWYEGVSKRYEKSVGRLSRRRFVVVFGFVGLCALAVFLLYEVPGGFVPEEDQGYFILSANAPHGTTMDHVDKVMTETYVALRDFPNVDNFISVAGYNVLEGVNQPNSAVGFVVLKSWDERKGRDSGVLSIMARAQRELDKIQGAEILALNPPPIQGLDPTGGLDLEIQDREALGVQALANASNEFIAQASALPEIAKAFTTFDPTFPQRYLQIDRTKAKSLGVDINDLFETLQINLGSLYVNNLNKFGRVYSVYVQADAAARSTEEDIARLRVRNETGEMIELAALVKVVPEVGPYALSHYNLYPSASVTAIPASGISVGQARKALDQLANTALPFGFGHAWTGTVFQEIRTGNLAPMIFALSLVFVFFVLSALFESWTLPVVVILAVPIGLLGAVGALMARAMALDVYGQIGLVMLIGLTAKNAILMVQFAQESRAAGRSAVEAAMHAARIRLRPILMTAFAFILGVAPLVFASGAGANSRQSMGTVVAGGMTVSTLLIIIVPVLYVLVESLRERVMPRTAPSEPRATRPEPRPPRTEQ